MAKRYIRIDIECEVDDRISQLHSFTITDNIKRILSEDMPYCKVIFTRNAPKREDLDKLVGHKND